MCKTVLALLLSVTSARSAEKVRKRSDRTPSAGTPAPHLSLLSLLLLSPLQRPKEVGEWMHSPLRNGQPNACSLLMEMAASTVLVPSGQAQQKEVCSWLPKRNVLSAWQRENSMFYSQTHSFSNHGFSLIYQQLNPGQLLDPCNSCHLGSLLLN